MAHEALVSLNLIIESLLNIGYRYTHDPILRNAELIHEEVWSLKSILELNHFEENQRLNAFKGEILEAIPKFRDLLQDLINKTQLRFSESESRRERSLKLSMELDHDKESEILNALDEDITEAVPIFGDLLQGFINQTQQLFSGYESPDDESRDALIFSQDLENVKEEMISFLETMKKINKEYNAKLDLETSNKESPLADEDFGGNSNDMVGVYDEDLQQLSDKLLKGEPSPWLTVISVVGMAGIGKTTIVKALYNDPRISDYFDFRAFIKVGQDPRLKDILLDFLVCLSPDYNKILGIEQSENQLKGQIYKFLKRRRFLIVLDDVWDIHFWYHFERYLPDDNHGSRIILTTRLSGLASKIIKFGYAQEIRFRNEEESWNLFCRNVFVPPGFNKVGKKIVKKCGGLPLGIISIAKILSKAEKSLESWEKIAKNDNLLALAIEEGSPMSEALFLSYKHLPSHLKECCLYFGVFPLNHEISVSKLIKLWVGERLVEPKHFKSFEDTSWKYLEDLVSHNIVLVRQHSSSGRIKTCSAHFFWHHLVREAANKKKFHLINSYPSAFSEGIHCQRRLCIHKNTLLGFKCVSESIESVSNVRSFLCTGPEHQYPVSICSGLTSIKVLDALTIRLYKFAIEILELVELKYLAFTYDGMLPSSISRLENLVYLIVHRYHMTIINSSPSYMPIEIWNMQELRHLQVMGSDLPHPVDGARLPNLLTLLGVSDRSCTKEVLQSIPNLENLGVRIVFPHGVSETLHIFDHLALLSRLKSFKCVVPNPNPRSLQVLLLPSRLTKLTLSGCGFAWKHMSMISALNNLRVLKLRCYAFQGPEWVVVEKEFPKLEHLLLEDTDLVHWRVGYLCFRRLKRLIIRHCYKLEEIPHELGELMSIKMIELLDCRLSAIASAKHILEEQMKRRNYDLRLHVYSSLDNEKH